jgi:hypothetical protein
MATLLLALQLQRNHDILQLRRMVRQAAELLGFDGTAQTCLAAAAFDLSCQSLRPTGKAGVRLEIDEGSLVATWSALEPGGAAAAEPKSWRLSRPLADAAALAKADVGWILRHLASAAPLDLFEEFQRINAELLQTLLALAATRAPQTQAEDKAETSAA